MREYPIRELSDQPGKSLGWLPVSLLILGMVGCKNLPEPSRPDLAVSTNSGQTKSLDVRAISSMAVVSMKPSLAIAGPESNGGALIQLAGDVDADNAGRIYVLDRLADDIKVFDRNGHFLHNLGRRGKGPGELNNPRFVDVEADSVFIMNDVLTVLDTAGRYISANSIGAKLFPFADGMAHTSNGILVLRLMPDQRQQDYYQDTIALFQYHEDGPATRRLSLIQTNYKFPNARNPKPLGFGIIVTIGRDGRLYHTVTDSFDIEVHSANGAVEKRIKANPPAVRATKEDLNDAIEKRNKHFFSLLHIKHDAAAEFRGGPKPLRNRPFIGDMIVGDSGNLLVKRMDVSNRPYAASGPNTSSTWLQLGSDGSAVAEYALPAAFKPTVWKNCSLYGISTDEDGVGTPMRFMIPVNAGTGCVGTSPPH